VAMRNISAAPRSSRGARSEKLSAAERSSLNQALAKALAFKDSGKLPEAREWAAELIRLLKSHDLLTLSTRPSGRFPPVVTTAVRAPRAACGNLPGASARVVSDCLTGEGSRKGNAARGG